MEPVHEIAIRKVKAGKGERFRVRRAAFIRLLEQQPGATADREFESFHALPAPDDGEVFIGMTTYESLAANAKVQRNPRVLWRFLRFATTMDLKAYVYVRPTEGPPFALDGLAAAPGQVLEVAVRRVTDHARFDTTRKAFVDLLAQQPGVESSWEFEVVKGRKADGLTVGMTVYAGREALTQAQAAVGEAQVTGEYFGTFDPVAVQYATSGTNH